MILPVYIMLYLQVSGIVGRADLLCAILFISSFLLYIEACATGLSAFLFSTLKSLYYLVKIIRCPYYPLYNQVKGTCS
jgi:hypothetical protein